MFWASFKTLVGIFSQTSGPACEFWADPVDFSFGRRPSSGSGPQRSWRRAGWRTRRRWHARRSCWLRMQTRSASLRLRGTRELDPDPKPTPSPTPPSPRPTPPSPSPIPPSPTPRTPRRRNDSRTDSAEVLRHRRRRVGDVLSTDSLRRRAHTLWCNSVHALHCGSSISCGSEFKGFTMVFKILVRLFVGLWRRSG